MYPTDDNALMREYAEIQSNVKGYRTDFEVKTEGSVTAEGFEFAKSGSFKRIVFGMEVEGKLTTKPRIQKEFQVEFKGVQCNLSNARYEELVAMTPDPGTQVFDHVSDKVYFVGEEEKAWPLLPPPDAPKVVRAKDFEDSGTVEKAKNAAAGPGEREHTHPIASSRQEADMMLGKRVVVVGEARTGKTPNVRVTSDFYVVCHGDFRWQGALTKRVIGWPESLVGERVQVIGRIEKAYLGETNSVPIVESNYGYVLWDGIYEMAKPQPTRAHMTYQEILVGRAAPDLNRLAERSAPSVKGTDATETVWDILKLRETGDKEAIPVLEKILLDNLETTRTHGFAAAQALFCIDPAGTSHLLSRHLLTGQYRASLAFKYTGDWEMQEPQRNRFIDQYLLQNVSTNLLLELTAETTTNTDRLNFVLTLRNASEMPLQIPDRTVYLGQHLFFRERLGQFARSGETVTYEPPMRRWIELGPGRTHRLQIQTVVKPAGEVRSARHLISPQAAVVLITGDYLFDIGKPGSFQVMAIFEDHGTGKGHWEGRVVSKPVRIAIPGAPAEK